MQARYSDGRSAASHLVEITVSGDVLQIRGEGISEDWKISSLQRLADPEGGVIRLRLKGGEALLTVEAGAAAQLLALLPGQLDPKRSRRRTTILAGTLTGLAIALVLFLFVGLPAVSGPVARTIPTGIEERLGERSREFADMFTARCETPALAQAELDALGAEFQSVSGSDFDFKIEIVQADFPNAFAMPGGYIIITDDLIDLVGEPVELAGVLAHEAAHVAERHAMAAQLREMGFGILLQMIVGGGSGAGQDLAAAGATLESLRHTRGAEREADALAVRYLGENGYDAEGVAKFFERLADEFEGEESEASEGSAAASTLLRTHPDTRERAAESRVLAQAWPAAGRAPFTEEGWAAISTACDGVQPPKDMIDVIRERLPVELGDGGDGEAETPEPADAEEGG